MAITADDKAQSISSELSKILHERYAKDMRQAIHDAIKKANRNALVAIVKAKDTTIVDDLEELTRQMIQELRDEMETLEGEIEEVKNSSIEEIQESPNIDILNRIAVEKYGSKVGQVTFTRVNPNESYTEKGSTTRFLPGETVRVILTHAAEDFVSVPIKFKTWGYDERSSSVPFVIESDSYAFTSVGDSFDFVINYDMAAIDYAKNFVLTLGSAYSGAENNTFVFRVDLVSSKAEEKVGDMTTANSAWLSSLYFGTPIASDILVEGVGPRVFSKSNNCHCRFSPGEELKLVIKSVSGSTENVPIKVYGLTDDPTRYPTKVIDEWTIDYNLSEPGVETETYFTVPYIEDNNGHTVYNKSYSGFYITIDTSYEGTDDIDFIFDMYVDTKYAINRSVVGSISANYILAVNTEGEVYTFRGRLPSNLYSITGDINLIYIHQSSVVGSSFYVEDVPWFVHPGTHQTIKNIIVDGSPETITFYNNSDDRIEIVNASYIKYTMLSQYYIDTNLKNSE
jgi:hypothetical protein